LFFIFGEFQMKSDIKTLLAGNLPVGTPRAIPSSKWTPLPPQEQQPPGYLFSQAALAHSMSLHTQKAA